LPGTAAGYLVLLEEVLASGYRPDPDDLAARRGPCVFSGRHARPARRRAPSRAADHRRFPAIPGLHRANPPPSDRLKATID
ncbi:hypothetical protein ACWCQ4_10065, partial [Streptomyces aureus]